jgi:hypothetical protein
VIGGGAQRSSSTKGRGHYRQTISVSRDLPASILKERDRPQHTDGE